MYPLSIDMMIEEVFSQEDVMVNTYCNVLSVMASPQGLVFNCVTPK